MKCKNLLAGLLLLIVMICTSEAVLAEDKNSVQTYAYHLEEASLTGYQSSHYQYFEIERYWDMKEASIELTYQMSSLINVNNSSITLFINETPFHSFRPIIEDGKKQTVSVSIPTDLLIEGVNTIKVEGYRNTLDDEQTYNVCLPDENQDNWLNIDDASFIAMQYELLPLKQNISDFYERFVGLDTVQQQRNAIVVSSEQSNEELGAAVYGLAGIAKANALSDKPISIYTLDDKEIKTKQYLIYMAEYSYLPAELRSQISEQQLEDKAVIQLVKTNQQSILVVTSQNKDLLMKAGKYIANQELMQQTMQAAKAIDETTNVLTPAVQVSKLITLTETGDKLTGPMHQEKTYFVSLPANQAIAEATKIRLDFRYSKNLDFDRSLVTISINDKPIGSKRLYEELANQDFLEISIPKHIDVNGNFTVKVEFDLELEAALCVVNQDQMPWAFIDSTSMLQLNTVDRWDLLFNYYPSHFLRNGGFNQIAVVLPQDRDASMYRTISNLFNLLGRYAQNNHGEISIYSDNVDSSLLENKQIIAIGSYQNNNIIRMNNNNLYFKYDPEGLGFVSNEKKSIESEYGKKLGALQLIASPYSEGFGMLVITGSQSMYYEAASQLLAKESTLWRLYGDGILADMDGSVLPYQFKENEAINQSIVNILERPDMMSFAASALLTLVIVIVAVMLITRKYWRKRRKKNEKISKQLNF